MSKTVSSKPFSRGNRGENGQKIGFVFQEHKMLLFQSNENEYQLPNHHLISKIAQPILRKHMLGKLNNRDCYCGELSSDAILPEGLVSVSLRLAFDFIDPLWYGAITKAYSIINWDKTHQYCGFCGHQTIINPGKFEKVCPACGLVFYPRISPSIIVLIKKGQEILMARSHHFPPGVYGLIAGFVEAGENIEDTLHREVKEEVGITIKNLKYFGSQSWPFPDSLMIGFTAEYESGELTIDKNEIEDAGWYRYDKIPGRPKISISIASKLIDSFIKEQT